MKKSTDNGVDFEMDELNNIIIQNLEDKVITLQEIIEIKDKQIKLLTK